MLSLGKYNFISSIRISSTMLKDGGKSRNPYFIPDFRGKVNYLSLIMEFRKVAYSKYQQLCHILNPKYIVFNKNSFKTIFPMIYMSEC